MTTVKKETAKKHDDNLLELLIQHNSELDNDVVTLLVNGEKRAATPFGELCREVITDLINEYNDWGNNDKCEFATEWADGRADIYTRDLLKSVDECDHLIEYIDDAAASGLMPEKFDFTKSIAIGQYHLLNTWAMQVLNEYESEKQ